VEAGQLGLCQQEPAGPIVKKTRDVSV
jgi:hypothetical protein